MKNRILIIALLILSFTSAAKTQTQPNLPAEKIAKIETAITSFMSRQSVPALSIAIVEDNQLRFQRGYGIADVENFVLLSARRAIDFTIQRFSFG